MSNSLAARLQYNGGSQLERIKLNKLRSLRFALKNDYNSRLIRVPNCSCWRALINTDSGGVKSDYDKKFVSVEWDSGLVPGDTFECLDDGTHWMVYLQQLTETAYLRSEIIRCRYTIEIDDITYWIYFQGPTETDLRWFQKNGINANELNLSGTVYIKKDAHTEKFFRRFTHIKLDGHTWEVQVTDRITVPGIIELEVQEYYDNSIAELPEVIAEGCHEIQGRETVQQQDEVGYMIRDSYATEDGVWQIKGNSRVKILDSYSDNRMCKVKVHDGAVGSFKVIYSSPKGAYSMDVQIAPRSRAISGPQEVYPYDIVEYSTDSTGKFHVETGIVEIVNQTGSACALEVKTAKKGSFTLYFAEDDTQEVSELSVKIGSL
jgi:hypothetical protein